MRSVVLAMTVLIACRDAGAPSKTGGLTQADAVSFYQTIDPELRAFENDLVSVLGDHPYRCGTTNDPNELSALIATVGRWAPAHQPRSMTWLEIELDCGGQNQSLYATTWVGGRAPAPIDQGPDVTLAWGSFAASTSTLIGINVTSRRIKAPEHVLVSAYYAVAPHR